MAAVDLSGSRLFRLQRELTELRSRIATTRHLARLRRKEAKIARQRAEALIEEARRLLKAPPTRR